MNGTLRQLNLLQVIQGPRDFRSNICICNCEAILLTNEIFHPASKCRVESATAAENKFEHALGELQISIDLRQHARGVWFKVVELAHRTTLKTERLEREIAHFDQRDIDTNFPVEDDLIEDLAVTVIYASRVLEYLIPVDRIIALNQLPTDVNLDQVLTVDRSTLILRRVSSISQGPQILWIDDVSFESLSVIAYLADRVEVVTHLKHFIHELEIDLRTRSGLVVLLQLVGCRIIQRIDTKARRTQILIALVLH